MTNSIQVFEYEGQTVEFDFSNEKMMINATEMAKIYGKRIDHFLENEGTKAFIHALKFPLKGGNLAPMKDNEIMISRGRSGTWMCRILALKFAAYLNTEFEVWVYFTIDRIIFGTLREDAKIKKQLKDEREVIMERLLENEDYKKLQEIDTQNKQVSSKIVKQLKTQMSMFE